MSDIWKEECKVILSSEKAEKKDKFPHTGNQSKFTLHVKNNRSCLTKNDMTTIAIASVR